MNEQQNKISTNAVELSTFNEGMKPMKQLMDALYVQANACQEDDPLQLQEKLTLFGQIYEIAGDFEAEATGLWKLHYAYRQETHASAYMSRTKSRPTDPNETPRTLTGKERDAIAERATFTYRRLEAEYERLSLKWANRKKAILEQINIMKRKQDGQLALWGKANYINGYS